jgi:CheY-like chemotaxis protein
MITAYGDEGNRRRALDNGASDFITKPVDFAHFKQALRRVHAGEDR